MAKIRVDVDSSGIVRTRAFTVTGSGWRQLSFSVPADKEKGVTMGDAAAAAVAGLLASRDEAQAGASKSGRV